MRKMEKSLAALEGEGCDFTTEEYDYSPEYGVKTKAHRIIGKIQITQHTAKTIVTINAH